MNSLEEHGAIQFNLSSYKLFPSNIGSREGANLQIGANIILFLLILCGFTSVSGAASRDRWVGTWAAAPFSGTDVHNDAAKAAYAKYGGSDTTFREIVHTSIGGSPYALSSPMNPG